MRKLVLISFKLFIIFSFLHAQSDTINVHELTRQEILKLTNDQLMAISFEDLIYLSSQLGLSVDELLKTNVSVGTNTSLTQRETAGIVSVVTRDQILQTGARDLVDVFRLVPGLDFAYDVDGVIGLGMRGNWGLEGKILVLLDGQEMNEGMYSTVNFGSHFPVDQIERIEIIRGAGSTIYGGNAELGVVNIITRSADDFQGFSFAGSMGFMQHAIAHETVALSGADKGPNSSLAVHGFFSTGNRSNRVFTDFDTIEYDMADEYSAFMEQNLNLGVKTRYVNGRFIFDDYRTNITTYEKGTYNRFQNILGEVNHTFKLNSKLSLTPRLRIKSQLPYNTEDIDWYYRKRFMRYNGLLKLEYNPFDKLNIMTGVDYYYDLATDRDTASESVFYNDKNTIHFYNIAAYLQAIYRTGKLNPIAGCRFDYHSEAGPAFSPRTGVTGILGDFHYKALYSQAFRSPSVENINAFPDSLDEPDIKPERTSIWELETGYRISKHFFITANVFDITIHDPIVYFYSSQTIDDEFIETDEYRNYDKTGANGAEVEFRSVYNLFYLTLSYSYYSAAGKNEVDLYNVTDRNGSVNEKILKAFPQHKIAFSGGVNITGHISLNINGYWCSARYGIWESRSYVSKIDPSFLGNLCLRYCAIQNSRFSVSVGLYNLFDTDYWFLQASAKPDDENYVYYPYPDGGRELLVKVRYDLEPGK